MMNLSTKQVVVPQVQTVTPPPLSFTFPKPLSYEFRVAEYINNESENKVLRVSLQVKVNEHDEYGAIVTHGTWQDVPRIKLLETK